MLKQIRNAIAAIVEAETGLTEWAGSPDGSEPMPALGYFVVYPLVLPGFGDAGLNRINGEIALEIRIRFVTVPDPATRLGEMADKVEAVRTRLAGDIDADVDARLAVDGCAFAYSPGYADAVMAVSAFAILTT